MCLIHNRIRKVKCDENKPFCLKCVKTGRVCEGYESRFRPLANQSIINAYTGSTESKTGLHSAWPTAGISSHDIDLLQRCFSTKTLFGVGLGCDEEAKQVLQASLTDPLVRHAVLSLKAIRKDLETTGDDAVSLGQQTPGYNFGLQQYNAALSGLASNLSSLGSNGLESALLCCQLFISIEQARKNYTAMAQHITQGLRIMHEYRARPYFVATNKLVPAHHDQLPRVDIFVIKLFAAPCKFADFPDTTNVDGISHAVCGASPRQQPVEPRGLHTISPDMRTELTRIATSTLNFLSKVTRAKSSKVALLLLSEKAALLDSLMSWLINLELVQAEVGYPRPEPISVSFLRLFHLILRIVLLGALDCSPELYPVLRIECDRLQCEAGILGERVKNYTTCSGTKSNQPETL